ncbi:MAG: cytochrome c [Rubrivivax sp.]
MKLRMLMMGLAVAGAAGATLVAAAADNPAVAASAAAPSPAVAAPGGALYTVKDGTKVDSETMKGFRAWRAAACDRCHGANQEGLVGPSLLTSFKTLTKADFAKVVTEGRLVKGMPSFGSSAVVTENIDHLYAYLKGRSDGAITQARVQEIK